MNKKFILPVLLLALSTTLASCSNGTTGTSPTPSAPAVAPTPTTTPTSTPTPSHNTITEGLEDAAQGVENAAKGAVDDMEQMAKNAGDTIRND